MYERVFTYVSDSDVIERQIFEFIHSKEEIFRNLIMSWFTIK